MADFTNKYPYTDFHELNLDWFLEEFKKVTDKVTTLDATVQEFTDFVTNYFDNLDVQQEINNKLDQMAADGTLAALLNPFFIEIRGTVNDIGNEVSTQNGRILVLEQRMDTFASLPPGSTAGNAELLDIRDAYDGQSYASAGDAVRGQAAQLATDLTFVNFSQYTGSLAWDTVNKTIDVSAGWIVCGVGANAVTATTLSYSSFANMHVLYYDIATQSVILAQYNNVTPGYLLAVFVENKMYWRNSYSRVSLDGAAITPANILDGFAEFYENDMFFETTASGTVHMDNINVWILKLLTITPGSFIRTIEIPTDKTGSQTVEVSYWNADTGAKYFAETITKTIVDGVLTLPINHDITVPTKIGFKTTNEFIVVQASVGVYNLEYVTTADTNLSAATDVAYRAGVRIYGYMKKEPNIYHVGEGEEYAEIQDAIEAITGEYGVIMVHPKATPYKRFSLMRSLNGAYPWSGLSTVKHISIIGDDKTKCVVQDDSGDYETPPAEIATNGLIKGITFIATHNGSAGTETNGSYAVHVDNRPADANGMKLMFNDCRFVSYQASAVGLGLYRNQDISFEACDFESHTDIAWKPNASYNNTYMCELGAFFMHTTMGYAGGNMFIRFKDCKLIHDGGTYSMRIVDNDSPQTGYLEAINNTLWDVDNADTGYIDTGSNPIMQMPYNNGNNASEINQ